MKKAYKKNKKKLKQQDEKKQDNHQKSEYISDEQFYLKTNVIFENYYKIQFVPYFHNNEEEFDQFFNILQEKLPVVFRVNETIPFYQKIIDKLSDPSFIQSLLNLEENSEQIMKNQKLKEQSSEYYKQMYSQIGTLRFQLNSFYPNNLSWSVNIWKILLKKGNFCRQVHQFIKDLNFSGLITRQELVSQLPPLFLDIQQQDIILDMCAAPGSKTEQILQFINKNFNVGIPDGFVIANDVDIKRANMLIHQLSRTSTTPLCATSYSAQLFPSFFLFDQQSNSIEKIKYDKILCDVPCSSDGTIRKTPQKWKNWHTRDAMGLHPLQVQILLKALHLVKVGGLVVYSTCSLNPIEDEAVITEAFRKIGNNNVKLIDIHSIYTQIKAKKGLNIWKVLEQKYNDASLLQKKEQQVEDLFYEFKNFDNWQEFISKKESTTKTYVKKSMFPGPLEFMDQIQIQNCMRILPHDQNSGGFFICLLQKVNEFEISKKKTYDLQTQKDFNINQTNKNTHYQFLQKDIWEWIKDFYGLPEQIYYNFIQYVGCTNNIYLISNKLSQIFQTQQNVNFNILTAGSRAFTKIDENFQQNICKYRLCQESSRNLISFLSKRKIKCDSIKEFQQFIFENNLKHEQIINENLQQQFTNIGQGSLCIYYEEIDKNSQKSIIDTIVARNFQKSVQIMCNKELLQSFKIRYSTK